jgi:hypothetical protein
LLKKHDSNNSLKGNPMMTKIRYIFATLSLGIKGFIHFFVKKTKKKNHKNF